MKIPENVAYFEIPAGATTKILKFLCLKKFLIQDDQKLITTCLF